MRATLTRRPTHTRTHSLRHHRSGHHRLARPLFAPHRTGLARDAKWAPLQAHLHHWPAVLLRKARVVVSSLPSLLRAHRLALEAMAKVAPVVQAPSVAAASVEMPVAAQAARTVHTRLVKEVAGMGRGAFRVVLGGG